MVAVKDRLRLDTLDCPEQERDQCEVFCCNEYANPPLANLPHIVSLDVRRIRISDAFVK